MKTEIECCRILKFDAGHRVVRHESKCRTLHGHEYKAEIYCKAPKLDELGRVIDFGVIKQVMGNWIDRNLDHNMIIWEQDPDLPLLQQCSGEKPIHVVPFNPTAENLASYLIRVGNWLLEDSGSKVKITRVRLWETSNCYVEAVNVED